MYAVIVGSKLSAPNWSGDSWSVIIGSEMSIGLWYFPFLHVG